jgi:thiol:disulfide interchange protein DsbA
MQFQRRSFVGRALKSFFAVAAALAIAAPAMAQVAGKDYTLIEPAQPTDNPAKIEVIEFFSYGCPHCNDFNPLIGAWAAKLPADVYFKKVPVTFGRAAWSNIARLYYALETTGDLGKLDADVFKAIHGERVNLFDERVLNEWVAKKGVDPKKFADAFNSFGVMSKVKRAELMQQSYRVQGVPAVVVNGKYMIEGKEFNETLAIADKLIAKIRAERGGKK